MRIVILILPFLIQFISISPASSKTFDTSAANVQFLIGNGNELGGKRHNKGGSIKTESTPQAMVKLVL